MNSTKESTRSGSRITLVAVAGVRPQETIRALNLSQQRFPCKSVKLFTPHDVEFEHEVIRTHEMDYVEYNRFIIYELHKYIDTDYVLLVQDDGYVVNPDRWTDAFLSYDYIGAVWPIPSRLDNVSYRDDKGHLVRVGNGGFSFRSKYLLEVASKRNLEWKSYYNFWNEDGFICCHNRSVYEDEGCKFASIDIARRFSQEWDDMPIIPFGFHGKHLMNTYGAR
jgi:hypothetical protein